MSAREFKRVLSWLIIEFDRKRIFLTIFETELTRVKFQLSASQKSK